MVALFSCDRDDMCGVAVVVKVSVVIGTPLNCACDAYSLSVLAVDMVSGTAIVLVEPSSVVDGPAVVFASPVGVVKYPAFALVAPACVVDGPSVVVVIMLACVVDDPAVVVVLMSTCDVDNPVVGLLGTVASSICAVYTIGVVPPAVDTSVVVVSTTEITH